MRTRTRSLALALTFAFLAAAGCKKEEARSDDTAGGGEAPAAQPSEPAPPASGDCAGAASGYMDAVRSQLEKGSAELVKAWEPVWPKAKQLFQETCEKDAWSAEAQACFKAAKDDCAAKLTAQQRTNLEAASDQIAALTPRREGAAEAPAARVEAGDCAAAAEVYIGKAQKAVPPDQAAKWEPVWPKGKQVFVAECEKSGWNAEVIACFRSGELACSEKMTEAQQEAYEAMQKELGALSPK